MPISLSTFDKKSFLEQGALFGHQGKIQLVWGKINKSKTRPLQPAFSPRNFFENETLEWWVYENSLLVEATDLLGVFEQNSVSIPFKEASQKNFFAMFDWTLQAIERGNISKGVPLVFEAAEHRISTQELEAMLASLVKQDRGYIYGHWGADGGMIGLSPELLIEQGGDGTYKTMAVAGTTTLEKFAADSSGFLNDPKEKLEHQTVIDDIKQILQQYGTITVGKTHAYKTPSLVHLKTEIELEVKSEIGIEPLIQSLHPTAALGTHPRQKDMSLLKEFEKLEPRGPFGAPFAYSASANQAMVAVAIRNLIWDREKTYLGSGCGVVAASDKQKEWNELIAKRQSVKTVLGLQ